MGTPINRLPPELLTNIFQSLIKKGCTFEHMYQTVSFTLALCSVCSRWRSVILNNPFFWSRIPIGNSKSSLYLTQLCIERTNEGPIDIVACIHRRPDEADWEGRQELAAHASRIRSVYVSVESVERIRSLLSCVLSNQIPGLLATLSIRNPHPFYSTSLDVALYPGPVRKNLFKLYDQLDTLRLSGVSLSPLWEKWERCHFGQLRELVLSSGFAEPTSRTSRIITTASNLQLLEFHGPDVEWMANPTVLEPVLKRDQGFKILRLHNVPFEALKHGIRQIGVATWEWETEILIKSKAEFESSRSLQLGLSYSSTVKALSLDNREKTFNGWPVHTILKCLPNLRILTLEGFELVESILSGITRSDSDSKFPQLSKLRLHSCRIPDHDMFKSMVASHPIRCLEIWHSQLKWDGEEMSYKPPTSSQLYLWLREQIPEMYIIAP